MIIGGIAACMIVAAVVLILRMGIFSEPAGFRKMKELYDLERPDVVMVPISEDAEKYAEKLKKKKQKNASKETDRDFEKYLERLREENKNLTWPEGVEVQCVKKFRLFEGCPIYTLEQDEEESYDRIILYLHGGTYVHNVVESHVRLCEELVWQTNAKVILPMYQLAPNGNYRDAYNMLLDLYEDILYEKKEIVIAGDSAGGGLALGLAETLKHKNMKSPDKIVLISPWVDISMSNPEIEDFVKADLKINREKIRACGEVWADGTSLKDFHVSPIYGALTDLADTLIISGTEEILIPDTMKLFQKIREGGSTVQLILGIGMFHEFPLRNHECSKLVRSMMEEFIRK